MFCTHCGAQNPSDARFCFSCGAPISTCEAAPPAPAAAPVAQPAIPVTIVPPIQYAGFWRRFVAVLIDGLVLVIPYLILTMIVGLHWAAVLGVSEDVTDLPASAIGSFIMSWFWMIVAGFAIKWIYYSAFESSVLQATPGKLALGIIVTDIDGNRISFARATGRHFAKIISGLILYIGYIMAGLTLKKQALHDILAETLVVMKR